MIPLTREETLRYSRHIIMPEVGVEGQERLKAGSVLLVGTGGLGSPAALYLAAAGVGRIGLVDFDTVDLTNLQRQVIHGDPDLGRPKVDSAEERMREINPHIEIIKHSVRLSAENAIEILSGYDVVADGTDNFPTRYLVNDACVMLGKPNAYGSVFRFEGQASVFGYQGGPCYRCLFPEPPPPGMVPSCAEGGVLGILPGVIGLIQATEAVKLILGIGESLSGRLLQYSALEMQFRTLKIKRDPHCPLCGDSPTITSLVEYESGCEVDFSSDLEVSATELKALLEAGGITLIDVREPYEHQINQIPGSVLIPLGELKSRLGELPPDADIVLHCLSGDRSRRACKLLRSAGLARVRNLQGGIRAWVDECDPAMATY